MRLLKGLGKEILCKCWWLFPDELQIRWYYRLAMGKKLNLENPQTMNEKLQWLKINYRKPEMQILVDKIKVKDVVSKKIGGEYVVPLLGQWEHFDDIDFDKLPQQFVLKTNHSGGNKAVVIVPDKAKIDKKKIRVKLERSLRKDNIYHTYREWPYKDVQKKIFAERFLGEDLTDYKFYCFNGRADYVLVCIDRQKGSPKFYFFDKDWNLCRFNKRGKDAPADFTLPKPEGIDEMFRLASILSEGFPFVRMDFFYVEGRIYFGEYTFFPDSGYDRNRLPETDILFGNQIKCKKE